MLVEWGYMYICGKRVGLCVVVLERFAQDEVWL